mmetsp:Transcript_1155/g.3270  ORF Transcript_1155/g.3270 Transcript_1155/m.3270 type:complete len:217 (+) Transcript_1155:167-817(+)
MGAGGDQTASAAVGWLVSSLAVVTRVPQIVKILRARSVDGIEPSLYEFDTLCNTISGLYHRGNGFPLNTYGETISFSAQNMAATYLISVYAATSGTRLRARLFMLGYLGSLATVLQNLPAYKPYIDRMQQMTAVALQTSRLPQLIANFRRQSTGQLSIVPWVFNLLGSILRLYTTEKQLGGDNVMRGYFLASIAINGTMASQIAIYGNPSRGPSGK